jgi:hypothetical protein
MQSKSNVYEYIYENISRYIIQDNEGLIISLFPTIMNYSDIRQSDISLINNFNKIKQSQLITNIIFSSSKGKKCIHGDLNMITNQNNIQENNKNIFYKMKTKSVNVDQHSIIKIYSKQNISSDEFPLLNIYDSEYDFIEKKYVLNNVSIILTETVHKDNNNTYLTILCDFTKNKDISKTLILTDLKTLIKLFI